VYESLEKRFLLCLNILWVGTILFSMFRTQYTSDLFVAEHNGLRNTTAPAPVAPTPLDPAPILQNKF
jgi:hypothetical protein